MDRTPTKSSPLKTATGRESPLNVKEIPFSTPKPLPLNDRQDNHIYWRPFVQVSIIAIFVRAIIMAYGELQDRYLEVKFTDIDYWVFSDAAKSLADGASPFDRSTYRYTPLLAYLLLPNIWLHPAFGKVLFSILDLVVGLLMFRFLTKATNPSRAATVIALCWYLNPLIFTVSTRGNAESLISTLVLSFLYFLVNGHIVLSGVLYGLAVHLKIYPVIFAFAILSYLWSGKRKQVIQTGLLSSPKKVFSPQLQLDDYDADGTPKSPSSTVPSSPGSPIRESLGSPLGLKMRKVGSKERLTPSSPLVISRMTALTTPKKLQVIEAPASTRIKNILLFGLVSSLTFALTTGFCYWRFGERYLHEALLYHIGRRDHRHNFSPYFYLFYTSAVQSLPPFAEIITFIPQLLFFVAAGLKFGHQDLPFACFLIAYVFVTFNKVITSQYFLWYLSLLPMAYLSLHRIGWRRWVVISTLWFVGQGIWLQVAYLLEFGGTPVFLHLWMASLFFFLINVWIAGQFIRFRFQQQVFHAGPGVITQSQIASPKW